MVCYASADAAGSAGNKDYAPFEAGIAHLLPTGCPLKLAALRLLLCHRRTDVGNLLLAASRRNMRVPRLSLATSNQRGINLFTPGYSPKLGISLPGDRGEGKGPSLTLCVGDGRLSEAVIAAYGTR